MKWPKYLVLLILIFASFFFFRGERGTPFRKSYPQVMNTMLKFEFTVGARNQETCADTIATELRQLDRKLSRFDPASEISKVNQNAGKDPVPVSKETLNVIESALKMSELTSGTFDITVGPLVDAWDIMPSSKVPEDRWQPPSYDALGQALSLTGFKKVIMDLNRRSLFLPSEGMSLDLGGIAKGFALDLAAERLRSSGNFNFLIELGGNVFAGGQRNSGRPWKIGILHPRKPTEIIAWIEASDVAISTSGDYESYRIFNGERFNHIIDPRTGNTARGLVSVTIISRSATQADALSTAAFVLGPDAGFGLIEQWPDVDGIFIDTEMRITCTTRFSGKLHFK